MKTKIILTVFGILSVSLFTYQALRVTDYVKEINEYGYVIFRK